MANELSISVNPPFEKVGKAIAAIKAGAALQKGIEKLAFGVERFSKQETPVDTGRLRASINTSIGTFNARIGPHVEYAGWIHNGKMTRNGQTIYIKGRGKARTPPGGKPFMKLGAEKAQEKFGKDEILKEIQVEINNSMAGV